MSVCSLGKSECILSEFQIFRAADFTWAYGGIHCGEVFEFKLNDVWVPARVEMGMDGEWYLVGLPGLKLDGLEVRQK